MNDGGGGGEENEIWSMCLCLLLFSNLVDIRAASLLGDMIIT